MSIARNWRTRDHLLRAVRQVRRRWRLKLVLRGLALTLAGTLLTFLVSASTLEFLRFQPEAVVAFRVVLWLVVAFFLRDRHRHGFGDSTPGGCRPGHLSIPSPSICAAH